MSVPQNSKCNGVGWLLHPYMPCPGAWCSQSLLTVIHFRFSLLGILDLVLLVLPFIYSHPRCQSDLITVWILVAPVLFVTALSHQ